jgi:hypothetical protein
VLRGRIPMTRRLWLGPPEAALGPTGRPGGGWERLMTTEAERDLGTEVRVPVRSR